MRSFIVGTVITAIAFAIVQWLLPQVNFVGTIPELILVALVFGVVNGFIKPVVKILSFPINAMTLGLFGLVVNAALFLLVAWISDQFLKLDFTVGGFPTHGLSVDAFVWALIGSVALSIVSTVVGLVVPD
jgi:putative membrane protein